MYCDILSQYPTLLFVLRSQIIKPTPFFDAIEFLQCNYRIFQPFLRLRGLLEFPFPDGDLPLDFLNDPRRAGDLYSEPHDIAEDIILLWIQYTKKCLVEGYPWLRRGWLNLLEKCRSSPRILHELESLDVAQVCDPRHIHPVTHYKLHEWPVLQLDSLHFVLDWLQRFPDPPLQAIAFWEKQKTIIQRCKANHPRPTDI
ncbi:hypothetical protein FB451DRAFT_181681 [Mycena latifolia]|nr:hypothetical protein FB451DRAFT_181681 [Mycena latifolia]